jgi:N-hydroxyarylamine O-acetyltransferase
MTDTGATLTDAYLARVGVPDRGRPDITTLRRIHRAHLTSIPFENLDVLRGRGVDLDLDALRAKLVDQRRGGYCFEHNTLLMAVLRDLGFSTDAMEARVRVGATVVRPRTHMVLMVKIDGDLWLADVGFGGDGPLDPVPLSGALSEQSGMSYRIASEGPVRILQSRAFGEWTDLYAFLPQATYPVDFELANWFTSTHPGSPFRKTLTAQRTTPEVRYILRYPSYSEIRGGEIHSRDITRDELIPLLRETFLIDIPGDTTFGVIDTG